MFLHTLTSAHAGAGVSPDALVASHLTRSTLVNANGHLRFVYSDQSRTARRGWKSGTVLKRAVCVEARGTSFSRRETEAASQGRDWNDEGLSALGFD